MNVRRGDIVLIDYPFSGGGGSKVRPALVVQNDIDNQRLTNTIIVQITGVTKRSMQPTQVLIELSTPEGKANGLRLDSVVNCVNLLTLDKNRILRLIGTLPNSLMKAVSASLRVALEL
jgi:mRNA interferase MazF